MKLSFTLFTVVSFFAVFTLSTGALQAQTIEEGDYTHTSHYDEDEEDTESFPDALKDSLLPKIMVSPNPVGADQVKIWYHQLKGTSLLHVYDNSGRLLQVREIKPDRQGKGVLTLNRSQLAPGLYIAKLKSGIYESVAKFLVQ